MQGGWVQAYQLAVMRRRPLQRALPQALRRQLFQGPAHGSAALRGLGSCRRGGRHKQGHTEQVSAHSK